MRLSLPTLTGSDTLKRAVQTRPARWVPGSAGRGICVILVRHQAQIWVAWCGEVLMGAFRILVADDHPIFRFGLSSLLGSHENWEVCGEAADGKQAIEKCRQLKPDLLILDICMPRLNGVDAARQILRNNPEQRILVLTDVDSEQVIRDCLEAGVRGWV